MRTRTRARAIALPTPLATPVWDPRAEALLIGGLLCAGLCDAVYFLVFTLG